MNGRYEIYWEGDFRGAVHTIEKAVRFARVYGATAEVLDTKTNLVVWEADHIHRYDYA